MAIQNGQARDTGKILAHKTQDEDKQSTNTQYNTENYQQKEQDGPTKHWKGEAMCSWRAICIGFACFYEFSIGFWNGSHGVVFFPFLLYIAMK